LFVSPDSGIQNRPLFGTVRDIPEHENNLWWKHHRRHEMTHIAAKIESAMKKNNLLLTIANWPFW